MTHHLFPTITQFGVFFPVPLLLLVVSMTVAVLLLRAINQLVQLWWLLSQFLFLSEFLVLLSYAKPEIQQVEVCLPVFP